MSMMHASANFPEHRLLSTKLVVRESLLRPLTSKSGRASILTEIYRQTRTFLTKSTSQIIRVETIRCCTTVQLDSHWREGLELI